MSSRTSLHSRSVSAWSTLGDVDLAAGRASEAVDAYARALQQATDGADAERARLLRQQAIALVALGLRIRKP